MMTGKERQAPQRMLVSSLASPVEEQNVAVADGFPENSPS